MSQEFRGVRVFKGSTQINQAQDIKGFALRPDDQVSLKSKYPLSLLTVIIDSDSKVIDRGVKDARTISFVGRVVSANALALGEDDPRRARFPFQLGDRVKVTARFGKEPLVRIDHSAS